jgi:hypothetical protein
MRLGSLRRDFVLLEHFHILLSIKIHLIKYLILWVELEKLSEETKKIILLTFK